MAVSRQHGSDLAARQVRELVRHDRPQADRDPLHLDVARLLRARGSDGARVQDPALAGERGRDRCRPLQRADHDPRHGDGVPRRRPAPVRVRELPRPADDRRARRGLPAAERALVLALRPRRRRAHAELLRRGRRREVGLDGLPAALDPGARQRAGPVDPLAAHPHGLVTRGRDQLHRDHPQPADARDELGAAAAVRLVDRDLRGAPRGDPARALGGADAPPPRPRPVDRVVGRADQLLQSGRGRLGGALPARVLVLRAPRGVRDHPARLRDHLRGPARLRAQADLRLQGDRGLDRRDRVLLDARVGAPHVHGRASRSRCRRSS